MSRPVSKSPRIGIVGAGPGGLSLARLLTEKGFADITVIERADRVGGKSLTVHHQGIGHEMGTCYVAVGYVTVKEWMKRAGVGEHLLHVNMIRTASGDLLDFKDFVVEPAGMIRTAAEMARYVDHWLAFHDWDLRGGPDATEGTRGRLMREEVAEPFLDWLRARDLDVIERFALRTMTVMGYGSLDRVPALYGLRWNMPSLLWSGVTMKVGEPVPGWQALWQHVAGELDVRLDHTITGVERGGAGFRVHTSRGDLDLDHLVLTGPLDEAAAWFPFTDEERAAFAVGGDALGWREYVTTLVDASGWFRAWDTCCFEARVRDAAAVAQGQMIVARRTGDKSAVAESRAGTRPDVYVCYQYGDPARSSQEMLEQLRADLAAEGATINSVLRQCRWKYAPQLTTEAIRGGAVARMERQQGRNNLWISGATASHEAVDNIVDYNRRLVERMALAFGGADPSSEETLEAVAAQFRFSLEDK